MAAVVTSPLEAVVPGKGAQSVAVGLAVVMGSMGWVWPLLVEGAVPPSWLWLPVLEALPVTVCEWYDDETLPVTGAGTVFANIACGPLIGS